MLCGLWLNQTQHRFSKLPVRSGSERVILCKCLLSASHLTMLVEQHGVGNISVISQVIIEIHMLLLVKDCVISI